LESLHLWEININIFLQNFSSPVIVDFFKFLGLFDQVYFYFILVCFSFFCISYKWGIRIFYINFISLTINTYLKVFFGEPRPCSILPTLKLVDVGKSYGFPSGAAQAAVLFSLILISNWKRKKIAYFVGVNYFFWISLSRLYLGVHFLSDVVCGWCIGFLIFLIFKYVFPKIENYFSKKSDRYCLLFSVLAGLWTMLMFTSDSFLFGGVIIGLGIGNYLKKNDLFSLAGVFEKSAAFMVAILFAISFHYFSSIFLPKNSYTIFFQGLLLGFWISYLELFLFGLFFRKKRAKC
jgi:membrane-associated phospholipid phosphatase